jgi:hypothetical protein
MNGSAADAPARRVVSTLLGHQHVEMAVTCLGSLLRFSAQPLRLQIHDDGSLTPADRARLGAVLDEPLWMLRPEADERMAGLLAGRRAARAFRAANPLAAKLLDATLLGPEELAFCDADVLFLRPFSRLFELPAAVGSLFMTDPQNAYSVRFWHLLAERRLRLASNVNSGIVVFRRPAFDLDLLEWFLSRSVALFAPVWLEQTCWALLGQAAGCFLLDATAIAIPSADSVEADRHRVALHFVSPVRGLLAAYTAGPAAPRNGEAATAAVEVSRHPARRLSAMSLAATEVERRWRRWRRGRS